MARPSPLAVLASSALAALLAGGATAQDDGDLLHNQLNFENLTSADAFPSGVSSGGPLDDSNIIRSDADADELNVTFTIVPGTIGPFSLVPFAFDDASTLFNLTAENPLLYDPANNTVVIPGTRAVVDNALRAAHGGLTAPPSLQHAPHQRQLPRPDPLAAPRPAPQPPDHQRIGPK